jgi:hypothetical protein
VADTPAAVWLRRMAVRPDREGTTKMVAADDQALPPDAERMFASRMGATTVEIPSSHVAMVSHPGDVAQLITTAAESAPAAT